MGRKSTKENKTAYQLYRENAGLTREKAGEIMEYVSADRIEKIESEKCLAKPDEVLAMAKCYRSPELCNYYCSHDCEIGKEQVPELQVKELSQIVLQMVASLNSLEAQKNRLIEITADGEISSDEFQDFVKIEDQLARISLAVDSMQLWVKKTIANGKIDEESLNRARNQQN